MKLNRIDKTLVCMFYALICEVRHSIDQKQYEFLFLEFFRRSFNFQVFVRLALAY